MKEYLIKFSRVKKNSRFGGSKGNFQKRRLRLMYNLKLRVTFKKLNIIMGREKSIQDRLESMLFWHGRTIFCHSVTKHSRFLKIQFFQNPNASHKNCTAWYVKSPSIIVKVSKSLYQSKVENVFFEMVYKSCLYFIQVMSYGISNIPYFFHRMTRNVWNACDLFFSRPTGNV